ncbi:aldo/keto reductase [Algihabitans albus]|uniref:aldo/keto reductase n=1 Tax=Algihabitans albus TaxID=2164067 RepID=UPI000E5CDDDB|nr:aldo/keto reductase [Algihabitans albus]
MQVDRRRFLIGSLGGVLGLAAAQPLAAAAWGQTAGSDLRRIPSSGQTVPAVGLGSWITFNVGDDPLLRDESVEVMAAFVEEGGGMIDCSPMYGSSQDTIGYGLERLGRPDSVFSAEKVWTNAAGEGRAQIAETRRKWGLPRFDLLQVHNLVAWEGHLDTLFGMKAAGELGYVGITTSHGRRHDLLERIMETQPIDFVQLTYNVLDRDAEDRLLPLAREKGIGVIVNRPFQGGALTRRLRSAPLPEALHEIGAETWAQAILKYILSEPAVTVAIPATTQVAHLRDNKAAARGPLPDPALRAQIVEQVRAL